MPLEAVLRRAIGLNLRYCTSVANLTADYLRDVLDLVGTTEAKRPAKNQQAPRPKAAMALEGAAGQTVVGVFAVENYLAQPVSGSVTASKLLDPMGNAAGVPFTFDPPVLQLNPGAQVLVRASAVIPESLRPGVAYTGEIGVPEMNGATVPVIVRRHAL